MLQTIINAVGLGSIYALMAIGIGLVFGVLRLINFAYGQLIMAGAFSIAITSERGWPEWATVVTCFGVVIALSLLMDLVVFRPLRRATPATMLVTTFAVAFLLQAVALLKFGPLGKIALIFPGLYRAGHDRGPVRDRALGHDRGDCVCRGRRAGVEPAAHPHERRAAHARGGDGLPDGSRCSA